MTANCVNAVAAAGVRVYKTVIAVTPDNQTLPAAATSKASRVAEGSLLGVVHLALLGCLTAAPQGTREHSTKEAHI